MIPLLFTDTSCNFLAGAVSLFWDPGFLMYSRLQLQAGAFVEVSDIECKPVMRYIHSQEIKFVAF